MSDVDLLRCHIGWKARWGFTVRGPAENPTGSYTVRWRPTRRWVLWRALRWQRKMTRSHERSVWIRWRPTT